MQFRYSLKLFMIRDLCVEGIYELIDLKSVARKPSITIVNIPKKLCSFKMSQLNNVATE